MERYVSRITYVYVSELWYQGVIVLLSSCQRAPGYTELPLVRLTAHNPTIAPASYTVIKFDEIHDRVGVDI